MTKAHGFELLREEYIHELDTKAQLWRHTKTGAELLSLQNDDENKVFGVTFRTPLTDSTGVAHILEHAVLAGSRKYPLKEPFVELIKGSLNTFVNAMTYPDKTCYPVASQNLQDFYNLIDVYLDAVFYPRLARFTFEQEGWHYELDDIEEPMTYKGVVFNEMKGVYASPDDVLGEHIRHAIFPDNTYRVDSGGNPQHIPDLTYEQFTNFHHTLYHPSNARIFFYGDDDPDKRFAILDEYLNGFERIAIDSEVDLQPRWNEPRHITRTFAAGEDSEDSNKSMLTVSWLLDEAHDLELVLALEVLSYILIGMSASPLRKALLESGLGEDLAGGGLEELRQIVFSTGLKGIATSNADAVEALVLDTLRGLAEDGIDPETVHAALNTIEFRLRENNTGSFPRGLSLMLRSLDTWLYDGDPFGPLSFEAPLQAVKERAANGKFFEELIQRYFLENTHRVTLLLKPDPEQGAREAAIEQARLEQAKQSMSRAELEAVMENAQRLRTLQETPDAEEDLAKLPSLGLADLDRENKLIPIEVLERGATKVLYHNLFTNGIVYLDIGLDLHTLPQELLPYVALFSRALLETGAGDLDYVQLSQRIGQNTGGIRPQTVTSMARDSDRGVAWLFLRTKAMPDQAEELLAILRDVLLTVRLDNQERIRQIVLEEKAGHEARLVPAGHQVVNARLRALFDEADWAAEQMRGISQLFFLRELVQQIDSNWPMVLERLQQIRRILVNSATMLCNVTLDEENWERLDPKLTHFLSELPVETIPTAQWVLEHGSNNEALGLPAQVNYVGKGANLYGLGYTLHGSEAVITNYLGTTWLWEKIRVQGGAYGGFCVFDPRSGIFTYVSYRDPNLLPTLEVYDGTGRFLREIKMSDAELTRAIIGAIGNMDFYQLPDAKGFTSLVRYLVGDSDELRQRMRNEILATTVENFRDFGVVLDRIKEAGAVVVLGSQSAIAAANEAHPDRFQVKQVL